MSEIKPEVGQWPPYDIVSKLIEAAEILLHRMDYNGDGYEDISHCVELAKQHIHPVTQSSDEDPDKWVVQDRVPVRVGVDEIHWSDWHADRWEVAFGHWYQETRHGSTFDGAVVSVRCRRRDLPPVEQPEQWPKCDECGGSGEVDSGGFTPWMSPINVPCGKCSKPSLQLLQPIETAPKDGTYILLFGPSGYTSTPLRCEVCRYDAEYRPLQPWVTYSDNSFLDSGPPPTHWMPLPTVPT